MNILTTISVIVFVSLVVFLYRASTVVIFSSTRAQILENGSPLKNATVVRRYEWNQENFEDKTTTDELGFFVFQSKRVHSLVRLLPIEIVVGQQISVSINGNEKKIWGNSKRGPEDGAEFFSKSLNKHVTLVCDLSKQESLTRDFGSITSTLCSWQ